ncbi:glutamate receptor ionotropic, kainate glr-3-like isoform X1 [Daphnia carinata]|uniref:glutamate receptor ionotropic, kainate glr-3-like isoform X1 n=1 Tax=Daphnia carinata TaxID=120202 RepID=UPI00286847B7|nr:glutamate receptor ionotropic, kainate glr-3-like isoform X1 [Daphnia carinata]
MKLTWLFAFASHVYIPILWLLYPTNATAIEEKFQQKNHLLVVVNQFPMSAIFRRNASGHIESIEGVSLLILDWIAHRYKFDYSLVASNTTTVEDIGSKPGHITNMMRLKADVMIAAMGLLHARLVSVEYVHPWIFSPGAFLLPKPEGWQNNVDAVIKPFQPLVWLGLVIAAISITVTLLSYNYLAKKKNKWIDNSEKSAPQHIVVVTQDLIMYIIGTLLNQGGYISCKITKIRLLVGAWCLLTLVLVNVYNGILISFVTTIRPTPPIINSETDVGYDPNIYLVVNRGLGGDVWFSSAEKGLYKAYGDKLRAYSKSKCNSTAICIQMVQFLPHQHVYFNVCKCFKENKHLYPYIFFFCYAFIILIKKRFVLYISKTMLSIRDILRQNYQQTKKCQLTILLNPVTHPASWGLPKKSPYLENFNQGTLRLHEIGLIFLWESWFAADTRPCWSRNQNIQRDKNEKKPLVRLSLDNLIGAFALLIVGGIISLFVFIMENFYFQWKKIR